MTTAALLDAPARSYVVHQPGPGRFPLVGAPVVVSSADHPGVLRVAGDLRADLHRVTGVQPALGHDTIPAGADPIIVGTLGRSPLIDRIVARGRLDVGDLAGRWETTVEQVVDDPLPGVARAFVIAGSDQRGTIFGAYDLAREIGVSPWHFWDDVPVERRDDLYVLPGRHSQGTPAVRYRGIFINDENPSTGTWAPGFFGPGKAPGHPGGLTSSYYAKVFETMLRLKANYLWPAVWGRAFAEDDPANHAVASYYGIVIGTSHEAPMMRGIEEWNRNPTGTGEWSFRRNAAAITEYWRAGARRMAVQDVEGVITLGMRGTGDVSLPDGDGVDLMREIIDSQRRILGETGLLGRPQVQTLYKEVQRYWDDGYRPPDDVTVVFCDDNWGNLRRLPEAGLPSRSGGYGLYYHFDYVGGGRNYKWADTINLTNTWEQLNLAYASGVDRLWMVNVGDLKNEEMPTQFFLDYAWNPADWPVERLGEWTRRYAAENFGAELAPEIAALLDAYGHLQSRRKPELLNRRIVLSGDRVLYDDEASPFSLVNYGELDRVTQDWIELAHRSEQLRERVGGEWQDAYFQLVHYQIKDTAILYELRRAQFTNLAYAAQGRAATNRLADLAERLFAEDQAMSDFYNNVLAGGKWCGWQIQPKIGYGDVARYGPDAPWQQPERDAIALPDEIYPHLRRITVPEAADMGVALDGGDPAVLPELSPWQSGPDPFIEVYNRGGTPFRFEITADQDWVRVEPGEGVVDEQLRATVTVDWRHAPPGRTDVPITVIGGGRAVVVHAPIDNPQVAPAGFLEAGGCVAIEADHYDGMAGRWRLLPGIGRTGNGLTPLGDDARLDYLMTLTTAGPVRITAYLSPRNNVRATGGLRYAIAVDGQEAQVVDVIEATGADDGEMNLPWARHTSDNINTTTTTHRIDRPGLHTLTFRALDPTIVVQRLVVDTGGVRDSYLGPPESLRV
ncbi:glycosyl hydrolase 115 family protein [Paractinoplanes rishiriensis]|uniref:Gylcosyl hydrolase 115 C-terminal domain-containing protein n=1 Tax=Paractinoplanes rishiriensis TaxID=1050105 RepID=A0A919JYS8_9ACTN|nr:glycosyl hydrolase 115 family protein [Actinoplanes rishiriensis]GIE97395.1 hypothetical protein Ari01nite_48600 [Actinoplanes rishiriensis]